MSETKSVKINNKSNKPDNIVIRDNDIIDRCISVQKKLPGFMNDYFIYLKGSVAVTTRLAYLDDIHFFCEYLVENNELTVAKKVEDITVEEFNEIKARDLNLFLGDYCGRYYKEMVKIQSCMKIIIEL